MTTSELLIQKLQEIISQAVWKYGLNGLKTAEEVYTGILEMNRGKTLPSEIPEVVAARTIKELHEAMEPVSCVDEGCPHYEKAIKCEPKDGGCIATAPSKQPVGYTAHFYDDMFAWGCDNGYTFINSEIDDFLHRMAPYLRSTERGAEQMAEKPNLFHALIACDVLLRNLIHETQWESDPAVKLVLSENTRCIQSASTKWESGELLQSPAAPPSPYPEE